MSNNANNNTNVAISTPIVNEQKNMEQPSGKAPKKRGTKQEVWDGGALQTKGGLNKDKLMLNKKNKVVSKARSERGHNLYNNYVKKTEN